MPGLLWAWVGLWCGREAPDGLAKTDCDCHLLGWLIPVLLLLPH